MVVSPLVTHDFAPALPAGASARIVGIGNRRGD